MKIPIIFLLLTSFTLFSCLPEDDSTAKKEELKSIILDYYNALAAKDLQKLNELTTANFTFFDEGSETSSEEAVKAVSQMKPFTVTFTIDNLNVHMDKKNASAYFFRKADFVFEDNIMVTSRFLCSATFNKEGRKWKLRFLHSSKRK